VNGGDRPGSRPRLYSFGPADFRLDPAHQRLEPLYLLEQPLADAVPQHLRDLLVLLRALMEQRGRRDDDAGMDDLEMPFDALERDPIVIDHVPSLWCSRLASERARRTPR